MINIAAKNKPMDWQDYLILFAVGVPVGLVNTVAGSGSLVSLAVMMWMGMPAGLANGTNRVAVLMQTFVGAARFGQANVLEWRQGLWFSLPAIVGALVGARLALDIDEQMMRQTIAFLLVFMFFLVLVRPQRWLHGKEGQASQRPNAWQSVIFFLIGVYGGFIQAGVGFFLIAGLVLSAGFDLVKSNAMKLLISFIFTPFTLVVFVWDGQVDWLSGFALGLGSMLGALAGAALALRGGSGLIRVMLMVMLVASALHMFGLF